MKTIYFIRHGSTPGNEGKSYQHPVISLSEAGIKQAEILAKRFETLKVDVIISSEMTRALMTAEAISSHNTIPLEKNPLFHEIMRPSVVRGKNHDDPAVKKIMDEIKARLDDKDYRHSDEENFFDLKERGGKALAYLLGRKEENIAVVTHGHILRLLMGLIVHGDSLTGTMYKNFLKNFFAANTGITVCKTFESKLTIHTWNDHAHLGEISS